MPRPKNTRKAKAKTKKAQPAKATPSKSRAPRTRAARGRRQRPTAERGMPLAVWASYARVCAAFQVPDRLTVSEWAAKHRVLRAEDGCAEPGPWSNDRAPYLVAIMDAAADPRVHEIDGLKAGQVGFTEAMRNVVAYWIDQDAGDVLVVLPDENTAKQHMHERIAPMLRNSPALRDKLLGRASAITHKGAELRTMRLHMAWAGAPSTLAGRSLPRVIFDEVDKYPAFSGREADPLRLGTVRQTTFRHRRFTAKFSTPTTRQGLIWQAWEESPVKLRWQMPCPVCDHYQVLTFAQVHWPKRPDDEEPAAFAERIELDDLAWVDCAHCGAAIREASKPGMLLKGVWAPDGATVTEADIDTERAWLAAGGAQAFVDRENDALELRPYAMIVGRHALQTSRIAFHLPALFSPWVPWSQLAAEFLRSAGNPSALMNFRNSFLAEPFEQEQTRVRKSSLETRVAGSPPPRVVPDWATTVIASADTQMDHFWYVVRAWGPGYRSQLLDYGRAETFAELRARTLDAAFPLDLPGSPWVRPLLLVIDAGSGVNRPDADLARTHEVYLFAISDPTRILALHGHGGKSRMAQPWQHLVVKYRPPTGADPFDVPYLRVNTAMWKDVLAKRMNGKPDAPDAWGLHRQVDASYLRQLASEHKILMRVGNQQHFIWKPVTQGAANHFWDCEVYNACAADFTQAAYLPPFLTQLPGLRSTTSASADSPSADAHPDDALRTPDGRPFSLLDR